MRTTCSSGGAASGSHALSHHHTRLAYPPEAVLPRRRRRWLVALAVALAVAGAAAGGGWWWLDRHVLAELPRDLTSFRAYRPRTVVRVEDRAGEVVDEFFVERRVWVELADLPPHVGLAFVSAEDRRFYEHRGVDPIGILRAVWVNAQAGSTVQGGSTLTQQLVKNLLVGKRRSYERKLQEAVLAWRLERELSKDAILELYVNYVYLGSGNYGVEAAARDYFGVSARDLDVGQAALLAGLVPAPSRYSPRAAPEVAATRRGLVLGAMVRDGVIDEATAALHRDDPVLLQWSRRSSAAGSHVAYVTQVRREVRRILPGDTPYELGLVVRTPLDQDIQRAAEDAVRAAIEAHAARQGRVGVVRTLPREGWARFLAAAPQLARDPATNTTKRPSPGECFEALVRAPPALDALAAGPFTFALVAEDRHVAIRAREPDKAPRSLKDHVQPGDVLRVCALDEAGAVRLDARPWAEGAAVVLENATGHIKALVGGYNPGLEGFVRATQARRQPGSSFKPYVYAAALLDGKTQVDTVLDAPLSLVGANGKAWSPKNYDGGYAGALPMRQAMARSLNTVAVRLAIEVGPGPIAEVARRAGVATPLREDLTMALGASEVTPMDQAIGYATFARMGSRPEAVFIASLRTSEGRVLAQSGSMLRTPRGDVVRVPGGATQVLPPAVAYELVDMLRAVVTTGTARRAHDPRFDRAGKTGTTNGFRDAWFVGMTPRHTVAVWVGTDGTHTLGESETGGRTALPAWVAIVEALAEPEGERFRVPDDAILVGFGEEWVGLVRGEVPASILRHPVVGSEPLPAFSGTKAPPR